LQAGLAPPKSSEVVDNNNVIVIDEEEPTPKKQKKLKQSNIMMAFGMSASISRRDGTTNVLRPSFVENSSVLKCTVCGNSFANAGALATHRTGCTQEREQRRKQFSLKTDARINNRGMMKRASYSNLDKYKAVRAFEERVDQGTTKQFYDNYHNEVQIPPQILILIL